MLNSESIIKTFIGQPARQLLSASFLLNQCWAQCLNVHIISIDESTLIITLRQMYGEEQKTYT